MPPLHILFVDDDSDESYLFNEALEHSGLHMNLSRANNGNHLISLLQNEAPPDMIIMDINMPYKDGVEALTEIRNSSTFKDIPVIIYSTTKNEKSIDDCYEKGADLFVVKPNNFDGMVRVVKQLCTMDWKSHKKPSRKDFIITEE